MNDCDKSIHAIWIRMKRTQGSFFKWAFSSAIIGIICGFLGTLFHLAVEYATDYRQENPYLLFFLPLIGLVIIKCYHLAHMENDGGTNIIISSIRSSEKIPFAMTPLIFIGTVLTHLFGGSSGREGAALQIGGSIGSALGPFLRLKETEIHLLTMCGMSGMFAALFGTPIAATIFSMEVISVGVLYYVAFVPCIFSSLIAYGISTYFGIRPTFFSINIIPEVSITSMLQVIILSALCAFVSMLFCIIMHNTTALYKKVFSSQYIRIFVGGCLIILLTLLVGNRNYNGAGMNIIQQAIHGNASPWAPWLKIIFTALTLGAGFKGGEIIPTLFIGATFGNVVGSLIGLDPCFAAAIGMVGLFCGVVNCPIASLFLSIELFGAEGILFFCVSSAVSYMLSGYYGLYSSQKIVYSKLRPHYININSK